MNISGIRPNAGFYDYNSIQNIRNAVEDTPVVKTAADAGASEQQQKDTLETTVRREQDFWGSRLCSTVPAGSYLRDERF